MSVVNVKVAFLRPKYKNLEEWCKHSENVYIGRSGIVFIDKARYPKKASIWANPFKITKSCTRESILQKYESYILEKASTEPDIYDLKSLQGKKLGCWCHPLPCHGDVLLRLSKYL